MYKNWMRIALLNFLIAVCIGALLRYAFVNEVSWLDFRHFLHAHSHVAMLGWVYQALFVLLIHTFLPEERKKAPIYKWLFWSAQLSVLGMLFTFPFMGYASWSIVFSSIHILISYVFVFRFLKDLAPSPRTWSITLAKTALILMVISTLALWAMGPIVALQLKGSAWYYAAVQFYLHFQFNGWFTFAVLALFFRILEKRQIPLPVKSMRAFYTLLLVSCFLTYALAVAWSTPLKFIFWTNSLGAALQLVAAVMLVHLLSKTLPALRGQLPRWPRLLFLAALTCFLLKILMQSAIIVPYMATIGFTIRNFVIGFIHLILLGIISIFLLGYANYQKLIRFDHPLARFGLILFLSGFLFSELILYLQGILFWGGWGFLPYYYEGLFGISVLMPTGILILSIVQLIPRIKRDTDVLTNL
ncbi:MAG: hypothetical protein DHS20C18_45780 [Saprospiraceae bacterium]|nr:MAG: hypothetical protein DHS20C18_45780 [Saprospiraceae bacterium]